MGQNNLPIEDLKEYGIINEDNSFSKKLSANDIKGFLEGAIIVADNNKDRITFQLTDDNSKLQVQQFHREKAIQNLLEDSKKEIQYVKETPVLNPENIEIGNTFKLKSMDRNENLRITQIAKDDNGIIKDIAFTDKNGEFFTIGFEDFKEKVFDLSKNTEDVKVFVYDEKTQNVTEYDLMKDIAKSQ